MSQSSFPIASLSSSFNSFSDMFLILLNINSFTVDTNESEKLGEKNDQQFLKGLVRASQSSKGIFSSDSFPLCKTSIMESNPLALAKKFRKLRSYPKGGIYLLLIASYTSLKSMSSSYDFLFSSNFTSVRSGVMDCSYFIQSLSQSRQYLRHLQQQPKSFFRISTNSGQHIRIAIFSSIIQRSELTFT